MIKEQNRDYKILLDGNWDLEDLYVYPKAFEQAYFFYFSLHHHENKLINQKIEDIYSSMPWRGGYSAVNFFNKLKDTTSKKERPKIKSMQYASPGWIELSLLSDIAIDIAKVVGPICGSLVAVNATYQKIYSAARKRDLLKQSVKRGDLAIKSEEISLNLKEVQYQAFLADANLEMDNVLKIPKEPDVLNSATNPLRDLKIKFAVYRRIRTLAEYSEKDKAKLPHKL